MKNRNFNKTSIGLLLPLAMSVGILFGINVNKVHETHGYDGISLNTLDIDLNDSTSEEIRNYYSGLGNNKSGESLLSSLKKILKNGQQYLNYDSGDAVWKIYEIADRDWEKSPASSIKNGNYVATDNVIYNYKFRASESLDDDRNPYIHALYVDRDVENNMRAYGENRHSQLVYGINREHIWPKSHGFDAKDGDVSAEAGARGDPMHLWAADGYSNNIHSNYYYGYVDQNSKDFINTKNKSGFEYTGNNYRGTSLTIGSGTVFEPQDSDKGDVARALFYMVARYNNFDGTDQNIDTNNPNLILDDDINTKTGISTGAAPFDYGVLSDLLEWNKIDPPDEFEIHRNNLLYKNFTHNRNPFIDFPQWADIAFTDTTNTANPAVDKINGDGEVVMVDHIEITNNPSKTTYIAGQYFDSTGLEVSTFYTDGSNKVESNFSYSPTRKLRTSDTEITINVKGKTVTLPITVRASTEKISEWILCDDLSDIVIGDSYVIAAVDADCAMSTTQDTNNRKETPIAKDENEGTITITDSVQQFILEDGTIDGTYSFNTGEGYIYAASDSGNLLKTETEKSNNSSFSISFSQGKTSIVANGSNSHKIIKYNSGNKLFSCYSTASDMKDVCLYRLVESGGVVVHPESITISPNSLELEINSSQLLITNILPSNATNLEVNWTSSEPEIVSVDEDGNITGLAEGTAIITATSTDEDVTVSGSCEVSVYVPEILSSLSISGDYKQQYYVGETFDKSNIVVTANYSKMGAISRTEIVTKDCLFEGFDSSSVGTCEISVFYNDLSTSFNISIIEEPTLENPISYKKISSLSELEEGSKILIGFESGDSLICLPSSFKTSPVEGYELSIDNGLVTDSKGKNLWSIGTLDLDNNKISITNGTNYISSPASETKFDFVTEEVFYTVSEKEGDGLNVLMGSRGIIYRNGTINKFGSYSTSNTAEEYHGVCIYAEYEIPETIGFTKVDDASTLRTGDEVIFVGINEGNFYSLDYYSSGTTQKYYAASQISSLSSNLLISADTDTASVLKEDTGIRFLTENGYLASNTKSSNDIIMESNLSLTNASLFDLTINESGQITMYSNNNNGSTGYFRFNINKPAGIPRFTFYKTDSTVSPVYIYKKVVQVEADSWASSFLKGTSGCKVSSWNEYASSYEKLSEGAKEELINAIGVSDLVDPNYNLRSHAMARYDYLLSEPKYSSGLNQFISERNVSSKSSINQLINVSNMNSSTIIIIVLSSLGATLIGGYFVFKRRKEQN